MRRRIKLIGLFLLFVVGCWCLAGCKMVAGLGADINYGALHIEDKLRNGFDPDE